MSKKNILKNFSLLPHGLRYKLLIAFCLMSVIPLLVIGYLVNSFFFLGEELALVQVSIAVLFCIIIAWLGLFLAKGIIERVVDTALQTKIIAEGNYDRKIPVDTGDEIGQIGEAVNFLTRKIKNNITDLREYQKKTKEINVEIQKRVSILSSLLQIGELISSPVKLEAILEVTLSKLARLYENGFAAFYFPDKDGRLALRTSDGLENKELLSLTIESGKGFLGKALQGKKYSLIDSSSKFFSKERGEFKAKYKCENLVAVPIRIIRGLGALLVVGNDMKDFTFTSDDMDVVKVFAEQVAIAVENDVLMKKAEILEIKDNATGLFNRKYITGRLEEEIKRSRVSQRPCAFILIDVDDFKKYQKEKGAAEGATALQKAAEVITKSLPPLAKAGRFDEDSFGLVLPEVNKKGAIEVAEKIRKGIEKMRPSSGKNDKITASSGVSENPLDGATTEEILEKAKKALDKAKKDGKNKVVSQGV